MAEIKIVTYCKAREAEMKQALMDISIPWLEKYDILEPTDITMLADPESVLDGGGHIFFAECEGKLVGTITLEVEGGGESQLLKFGVLEAYEGRGAGRALMQIAIDTAREDGCKLLTLTSCHQLTRALETYQKFGFDFVTYENSKFELSDLKLARTL